MIKFDLHMHTCFSPCSNMQPLVVLQAAHAAGLSAIAITDHNTTEGARAAHELWSSNARAFQGLQLFRGIEIKTRHGELNAVFLDEAACDAFDGMPRDAKGRFDLAEVIDTVTQMKTSSKQLMVGLNHPVAISSLGIRGGFDFDGAIESGAFASMQSLMAFFDYVELNTMNLRRIECDAAVELARRYGRPIVCNTDSHWRRQIGRYYTTGSELTPRECILAAQAGDASALLLPDRISYGANLYYRFKSGLRRELEKSFF